MKSLSRRQFLAGFGAGSLSLLTPHYLHALSKGASLEKIIRVINRGRDDLAQVSLTFDDCWYEDHTLSIAEQFAERGQKVTFFPAGLAIRANIDRPSEGHENLYARILEMGHEFGCHTFTHPDITDLTARRLMWWEIQPWIDVLNEALGFEYMPVAFRPPFGIVTDALYEALVRFDMPLVLWSADVGDFSCTPDYCQDELTARFNAVVGNGALLLQHTTAPSAEFVNTQLDILDELALQNVLLSEMLTALNEGENNDG
ncbi:MAG: polysaccharide deacetylase family protein [bacterium]|nr:polysaccharide deacetylase family protein [bacterium]